MSYGPNYRRAMPLSEFINQKVAVICTDGSYYVGILDGFDRFTNLILKRAQERIVGENSQVIDLGTFLIRGEMVAALGALDPALDSAIDWESVTGSAIKSTRIPY